MRILYLNPSDLKGGAAQVAWNLAHGMRARGHEVEYWVDHKSSDAEFVREIKHPDHPGGRSIRQRVIHRLGINNLNLDSAAPRHGLPGDPSTFDVIHLHDLPCFSFFQIPWLARQAPLIWTIHSMAPFTGNCIYSYGCERYKTGCGRCPQFGQWPLHWLHRDGSALNLRIKTQVLRGTSMHLIGVSDWIRDRVAESLVFRGKPIATIRNAVDPKRFFPVERSQARGRLGVPQDARTILLSVAGNPRDLRKGLDLALGALGRLLDLNLFLLPLGIAGDTPQLRETLGAYPGLAPRHVSDDAVLRDYYAAADVVWHPSRADTSSMVALEAFACQTPVIAAAVGGVPEVVSDGYGLLIPAGNSEALAEVTRKYFRDEALLQALKTTLRERSVELEHDRMLDEHESIYLSA